MGVNINSARFMAAAYKAGVSFERTLTLGRQWQFARWVKVGRMLREMGCPLPDELPDDDGWADELFRVLGAKTLSALDNSTYEGAGIVHDLNVPLVDEHHSQYDFVFDGGTLEHVFNFPVAMRSCMQLVKVGGHFCCWTPANNEVGHGFYQFGPELFYRLFQPDNGFKIRSIVFVEKRFSGSRWYAVRDAESLGARVVCVNSRPLFIMMLAQKIDKVPAVLNVQQSDYKVAWQEVESAEGQNTVVAKKRVTIKKMLERKLPSCCADFLKQQYRWFWVARLCNRSFFKRIDKKHFTVGD